MANKDFRLLSLKDKPSADNKKTQYSNLNLNQNLKSSNVNPVKISQNVAFFDNEKSQNNCGSFIVDTTSKTRKPSNSFDNFKKNLPSNSWNVGSGLKKEELKEGNDLNAANNNNSTLSLYIAAYENSIEDVDFTESNGNKNVELKKSGVNHNKQIFPCSISSIQNPFEFPRQQNEDDRVMDPEMMEFKASQGLLNPNQSSAASKNSQHLNTEGSNATVQSSVAESTEIPQKEVFNLQLSSSHDGTTNYTFDLDHWYLQYCLATGLYMLEPWERKLFNSFVLGCFAIGVFFVLPAIYSLIF